MRHLPTYILLVLYVLLEASGFVHIPRAAWLSDLHPWAPLLLVALLYMLIHVAVGAEHSLETVLKQVVDATGKATTQHQQLLKLQDEVAQAQTNLDDFRSRLASSDTLIYA